MGANKRVPRQSARNPPNRLVPTTGTEPRVCAPKKAQFADSSLMHWLSIGLAVPLVVCIVVALELLRRLRSRSSRDVEAQVTATVETLEARLDELAQELSSAVIRAEEEPHPSRFLGQIATTIDLDDAIGSTLQAAAGLPRVDAAVVELEPDGDGDEGLLGGIGPGAAGIACSGRSGSIGTKTKRPRAPSASSPGRPSSARRGRSSSPIS